MAVLKPSRREDFEVAIICALPLEYNAVSLAFDEFWDEDGDQYGRAIGDVNSYTTGRIGKYNVVLALLPQMGKANAAGAAASIRSSYNCLRLALLVGICGGVPRAGDDGEILLGDVIISKNIVQYDFGRQYPDKFVRKDTVEDNLSRPNKDVRNLLATFETELGLERLQQRTAYFLKQLQANAMQRKRRVKYSYPGTADDKLFESSYRHKHRVSPTCICSDCHGRIDPICDEALKSSCDDLGCDERYLVVRERLETKRQLDQTKDEEELEPVIHVGSVASGDTVMKSGENRDRIAKKENVIAFEMEGAGVWEEVPCIVVKGVCDYADCHKSKKWQNFAAATAASTSKAILERYIQTDKVAREVNHNAASQLQPIRSEAPSEDSLISHHTRIKSRLLQHLKFSAIRAREDRIAKAMTDTFEWIYREQVLDARCFAWDPFVGWLKSDAGLYWIAGKAGSGKSTLMKFLHSDPRTEEHLRVWAQDSRLIIAGHFFWNSGNSIQMSVEGLIRTLLYEIGGQLPDMLVELFPDRWAEMESSKDPMLMLLQPWATSECLQALRRVLSQPFSHFRFFFFVDGLDECSGDHEELTALLKEMAFSSHIRMCLASRPWSVFQDAFNSSPSLMLQHLTSGDIHAYVHTKFHEHLGFLELEKGDYKLAAQLCDDITEKASGVFLWVRLVVQSLLRGIADGDRVIDLMRRLKDLPEDLEMLFHKILDSVDPTYKVHSAQLFQIHRAASEIDGISLLRFSYADDDNLVLRDEEDRPLGRDEFVYRMKSMNRRLDSRTKGLLETTTSFIDEIENSLPSNRVSWSNATPEVQYLHRTLKDYIEQPEVWKHICAVAPSFSPHASLCKAYALEIKGIDYNIDYDYENNEDALEEIQCRVPALIADAMFICTLADDGQYKSLTYVLDALDAIVTRKFTPKHRHQAPLMPPLMMSIAVRYDVHFWVEELLKRGHPITVSRSGAPLIFIAVDNDDFLELPGMPLDMDWDRQRIRHRPSLMCLKTLLSRGANPYEEYEGSTAWSYVVEKFTEFIQDPSILEDCPEDSQITAVGEWLDVAEIFINHGASASLLRSKTSHLVYEVAASLESLEYFFAEPDDTQRLYQILKIEYESLKSVNACQDDCYQSGLKRKRIGSVDNDSMH